MNRISRGRCTIQHRARAATNPVLSEEHDAEQKNSSVSRGLQTSTGRLTGRGACRFGASLSMAWRSEGNSNNELINNLERNRLIKHDDVKNALLSVERRHYVRPDTDNPYVDRPLPIGHSVTISAPHMHAMCLEYLRDHLKPGCTALDIGSGSGYLTAVMGHMVKPDGRVYGVEKIPELVEWSKHNVKSDSPELLDQDIVQVMVGDGKMGLPEKAPFDCIHVGAAAAEVPRALVDQLKPGGRLVIPVGTSFQELQVIDKDDAGGLKLKAATGVQYVPLT